MPLPGDPPKKEEDSDDTGSTKGGSSNPREALINLATSLNDTCSDPREALVSAITAIRLLEVKGEINTSKREEEKKEAEKAARDATVQVGNFNQDVCEQLCVTPTAGAAKLLDVCRFRDPVLATAAVAADWVTIERIAQHVAQHVAKIERAAHLAPGSLASSVLKRKKEESRIADMAALAEASSSGAMKGLHGVESAFAATAVRMAEVGLAALAKVIEDRAKREGIVWFLQTMRDQLCGSDTEPTACTAASCDDKRNFRSEVRTAWFPATCALAADTSSFLHYGGGGDLLKALRGALASDLKGWPGAAAGLGFGASLNASLGILQPSLQGSLFQCSEESERKKEPCKSILRARRAAEKLLSDLIAGADAPSALFDLSVEVTALNRVGTGFKSPAFQAAACAASIPHLFQAHRGASVELKGKPAQMEALLLGALSASPACFPLIGLGIPRSCPHLGGSGASCALVNAASASEDLERLSTILRWADHAGTPARALAARWDALHDAAEAYRGAVAEWRKPKINTMSPPVLDLTKVTEPATLSATVQASGKQLQDSLAILQSSEQVKLVLATLALSRTAVDLAVSMTSAATSVTSTALYPGLCASVQSCTTVEVGDQLKQAGEVLSAISTNLDMVESALRNDWGEAAGRVVASVQAQLKVACQKDQECAKLTEKLSRYTGVFVALATENDPEKVARVLDDVALPVGGWRRKLVKDSWVVSIGSIPGFPLGIEGRWGQYGARKENGFNANGKPYFVAPTLTLPVGIDASYGLGWGTVALFASLLDPAAYLQYDVSEQGRLPGPQIVTALAPGLWARFAPFKTPFSLNLFLVFRPQLRAWEAQAGGPAADALQFGGSLSVDVTLFELFTSEPGQ